MKLLVFWTVDSLGGAALEDAFVNVVSVARVVRRMEDSWSFIVDVLIGLLCVAICDAEYVGQLVR